MRGMAILAVIMLFPALARAATLSTPAVATDGAEFALPLMLSSLPNEKVAGLQFDLAVDPEVFTVRGVDTGASVTQAGKLVSSNAVGSGRLRVIIAGLNQTAIPDGELIRLRLVPQSDADAGVYELSFSGVVLSDPGGKRLNADTKLGAISINAGEVPMPPTTKSKACGCAPEAGTDASPLADAVVVLVALLVMIIAGGQRGESHATHAISRRRP